MKRMICILIIWILYILPAYSQSGDPVSLQMEPAGLIEISTPHISENGDHIRLEMFIKVRKEAVNKRQSWTIRPVLKKNSLEENVYYLPYVLINGRIKQKHFRRRINYEEQDLLKDLPCYRVDLSQDQDSLLHYVAEIPAEEWVYESNLYLYQVLTSPARKKQYFIIPLSEHNPLKRQRASLAENSEAHVCRQPEQPRREHLALFYKTNDSVVEPVWSVNPLELSKLRVKMEKLKRMPEARIYSIEICGYASPDGSFEKNRELAGERARWLKEYLLQQYDLPEELIRVDSVAEDWGHLRKIVVETDWQDKDFIYSILDGTDDAETKEKTLKRLPITWEKMKDIALPLLRRVEVTIHYSISGEI